ncbi:hypothetical protein ACLOJK_027600 [Asimina triloba]
MGFVLSAGILTDPSAPSSFGAWLNYAATHHTGAISFMIVDLLLFFGVAVLTVVQASQISRNITTNEMANAMRYSYLRGPGGGFRNPYDHGFRKNCSDFLINGYNEDTEYTEEPSHSEGIDLLPITRSSNLQNGEHQSHHTNGNSHVCVDVDSRNTRNHGHSSHCSHNRAKSSDSVPLGLVPSIPERSAPLPLRRILSGNEQRPATNPSDEQRSLSPPSSRPLLISPVATWNRIPDRPLPVPRSHAPSLSILSSERAASCRRRRSAPSLCLAHSPHQQPDLATWPSPSSSPPADPSPFDFYFPALAAGSRDQGTTASPSSSPLPFSFIFFELRALQPASPSSAPISGLPSIPSLLRLSLSTPSQALSPVSIIFLAPLSAQCMLALPLTALDPATIKLQLQVNRTVAIFLVLSC